ncbi:hypothetical protein B0H67DRAFT_298145 [Lasiosphaeris hirsuta]|uniref:Uncharacterized protein n=1 Tax=Lasiosphaeris hirsuta TaxID=260670 RepID=A0AA40A9C5_9PEZI|nr:hypothetical protein B0H67DRAFT_298145 [Lasiosphaeris hirsuta]
MERDIRRDRGQWRGCYTFKDIICDGGSGSVPKRNGGLKMGHTYYYYYELDGASETHDPSLPSTNTCPYLPGQTVNTLWVPVEQPSRQRSASLSSMRKDTYMTMNPADKFVTPRPAPIPPETPAPRRAGTAPSRVQHTRSARSLSPGSGWTFSPRKLFSRSTSSSSLKAEAEAATVEEERRTMSSEPSRSRDISPESLRRFLSDDSLPAGEHEGNEWPAIAIPEDIVEENEDDDNFATSAVSESLPFTGLSPPPQRALSPSPSPPSTIVPFTATLVEEPVTEPAGSVVEPVVEPMAEPEWPAPAPPTRCPPQVPHLTSLPAVVMTSRFSFSDASYYSPNSPQSPDSNSLPSFYHSEDDDDEDNDVLSSNEEDVLNLPRIESKASARSSFGRDLDAALSCYSLPRSPIQDGGKLSVVTQPSLGPLGSPALLARDGTDVPVGDTSLLTSPIPNSGLEDLLNELGWMAEVIRGKDASPM